jgi:glucose/arabinose dehydrogenase
VRAAPLVLALALVLLAASASAATSARTSAAQGVAARQARSTAAIRFVRVASGFDQPIYATAPASEPNRLYVVEKTGEIQVLVNGKRRAQPFLDIRRLVSSDSEQGLLSVAFDPGYAKNRRIYVDYTDSSGDTRIVRYMTNGVRALPATRKQLLFVDQPYSNHNGGLVTFGPDGRLYVGMGDGGSGGDPQNRAQNLGVKLGKLLSIDPNRLGRGWKTVAYGLRNPWRYSFDRATGDLYIGDVGQDTWEEIDFVPAQSSGLLNFGWSVYEGYSHFKDEPLNTAGRLVRPVQVYRHEAGRCSVTGGYVFRGAGVPAAVGRYFYGDYCSGDLWTLRIAGGKAISVRRLPGRLPNISSFGEGARGELYATTLDGSLYRLR